MGLIVGDNFLVFELGVVPGTRRRVTPSETRREYVPVGSSKTSMFFKVSEGVTRLLVLGIAC